MVESWYLNTPYFTYNGKKFLMKKGEINIVDPGLAWKEIQFKLIPYELLPLSITVSVEKDGDEKDRFGFGYEELCVEGYNNQRGKAEFIFANHTPATRKLKCRECGHRGFCVETYQPMKGEA